MLRHALFWTPQTSTFLSELKQNFTGLHWFLVDSAINFFFLSLDSTVFHWIPRSVFLCVTGLPKYIYNICNMYLRGPICRVLTPQVVET